MTALFYGFYKCWRNSSFYFYVGVSFGSGVGGGKRGLKTCTVVHFSSSDESAHSFSTGAWFISYLCPSNRGERQLRRLHKKRQKRKERGEGRGGSREMHSVDDQKQINRTQYHFLGEVKGDARRRLVGEEIAAAGTVATTVACRARWLRSRRSTLRLPPLNQGCAKA